MNDDRWLTHSGHGRDALQDQLNYLRPRAQRMDYPYSRSRGWQIGAGLIETTRHQLIGQRWRGLGRTGPKPAH